MLQLLEMGVDADTRASQVAVTAKNPHANAGRLRDAGLIPRWGRSPGEGSGNPLQCFFPRKPHGQGAWWATVHRVAEWDTTE